MATQNTSNDSAFEFKSDKPIEQLHKRQRIVNDWKKEKTFRNQLELTQFFQEEPYWGYHYENNPKIGKKIYYRCKLNKVRSEACKSRIYTLHERTSNDIILYRNSGAHTHDNS